MDINTIKSKLSTWQAQRRQRQEEKKQKRIEAIAYQIYLNRRLLNKEGNAEADWKKAEDIINNSWREDAFALNQILIKVEKRAVEPFADWLDRADVFRVIERLSPLLQAMGVLLIPVVLAGVTYAYQTQVERREQDRLQKQEQKEGDRLQQQALKDYLNQLSSILLDIKGDDLRHSKNKQIRDLMRATTLALFRDPDFDGVRKGQVIAYLSEMRLIQGVSVTPGAYISGGAKPIISLADIDLSRANLIGVDLRSADLSDANLRNADLGLADLSGANLSGANFSNLLDSEYADANLYNANLTDANLSNANLTKVKFRRVEHDPYSFYRRRPPHYSDSVHLERARDTLQYALLCETKLPASPELLGLHPNRDCDKLDIPSN